MMGVKASDRSNSHPLTLSQLHLDLRDLDVFLMKGSKVDPQYVTSESLFSVGLCYLHNSTQQNI